MNKAQMNVCIQQYDDNIADLIIQKNGSCIYEYSSQPHPFKRSYPIYSITKSIVSLLIGIAFDRGLLTDINAPLLSFFPEFEQAADLCSHLTLRDVLTMRLPFRSHTIPPYEAYFTSPDWVSFAMSEIEWQKPATSFQYAPLIGPDLLSAILMKVSKQSVLEFANHVLFRPLGIRDIKPITFASEEEQLSFDAQPYHEHSVWITNETGLQPTGWGLVLSAKELLTIGQCILDHGSKDGNSIISKEWLQQCTSKQVTCPDYPCDYGYLWWVDEDGIAAMGDGGNILYISFRENIVIASTSTLKQNPADRITLIKEYLIPKIL